MGRHDLPQCLQLVDDGLNRLQSIIIEVKFAKTLFQRDELPHVFDEVLAHAQALKERVCRVSFVCCRVAM